MNILALDTSGPSVSVALTCGDTLVYECVLQSGNTHSESLMTLVDAAFSAGKLSPAEIDCYAAVVGPGSFTGVRIGVATVKAFAHVTGRPCVGVNALEAFAENVRLFGGAVCPMRDARAGQVYAAAFRGGERLLPDRAMPLADFLEEVRSLGRCCFIGDGAVRYRLEIAECFGEDAIFAPAAMMALRASSAASIAAAHPERAGNWRTLSPSYLRAPQAERERAEREARNG